MEFPTDIHLMPGKTGIISARHSLDGIMGGLRGLQQDLPGLIRTARLIARGELLVPASAFSAKAAEDSAGQIGDSEKAS